MTDRILTALRNFVTKRGNLQFFVVIGAIFAITFVVVQSTGNDQLHLDSMQDFANDTNEIVEDFNELGADVEAGASTFAEDLPADADSDVLQSNFDETLSEFASGVALISDDETVTVGSFDGNVGDVDEATWWAGASNNLYFAMPLDDGAVLAVEVSQETLSTTLENVAQNRHFYGGAPSSYALILSPQTEIMAQYGDVQPEEGTVAQLLSAVDDATPDDDGVYTLESQPFNNEESLLVTRQLDLDGWQVVGSVGTADLPTVSLTDSSLDTFQYSELGNIFSRAVEDAVDFLNTEISWLFRGLRWPIEQVISSIEDGLISLPWQIVILMVTVVAWVVSGRGTAYVATIAMFVIGLLGLWDRTMTTLAMLLTSMGFCVLTGIPLGILSARNDNVNSVVRSVLDAMQTIHPFVYLVPIVVLFGIGKVPGTIATIIFALPPMVRLTNLGIRQVPEDVVEAARAFGSSDWQLLRDVQIPLALPSIMAGVNQTLMLSLSMVVIVALIAGGGLGEEIYRAIGRADTGRAVVAGVVVLLLAVVVDRVSQGQIGKKRSVD